MLFLETSAMQLQCGSMYAQRMQQDRAEPPVVPYLTCILRVIISLAPGLV